MTGLIDFSTDAASNDVAAPPILWQEGQPAGTVNNSARAVMAALAAWRDDNAGGFLAKRSAGDAYAMATAQVFRSTTSDRAGNVEAAHTVSFSVDAANQGPATLSLDGCPAKPLKRQGRILLAPGDLTPDVIYRAAYLPNAEAYIIVWPALARPGRIEPNGSAEVPPGYLACDGAAVSRTAYAALFAAIGTAFGAGDGSTTFNVPNARDGRSLIGPGLSGIAGFTGAIGSSGGAATVTLTSDQIPSITISGTTGAAGSHDHGGSTGAAGGHDHGGLAGGAGGHAHTGTTGAAGGHNHNGSTDAGGDHIHGVGYEQNATYQAGSGGSAVAIKTMQPSGTRNASGQTDGGGTHGHTFTTSGIGDHAHGFSTSAVGDHQHGIPAVGNHGHAIPGASDHAHSFAGTSNGGGQAHPNMPPGLTVAFVIKG